MKSKITITLPMAMLALALASFSCAGLTITQNQCSSPYELKSIAAQKNVKLPSKGTERKMDLGQTVYGPDGQGS